MLAPSGMHVLLGRDYGVFFRRYASLEFKGIDRQWRKYAGTLTSMVTDRHATLAIGITSPGMFYLDKASLMPEDSLDGWRPDVVEAIRALKPGIIRFGGSSLIFYQWQNGIGPRERRAPFENRPWGNLEENDVGLHEFLRFCELVEAEPLICLNSNSTTVQQVLEEIEYCNGPADTPFGAIRAAMGHPEPFNVRYWQIGNEQEGEEYERVLAEYARAIRQRHPELVLLASYPSDRIVGNLSEVVDYVCPHLYDPYTPRMEEDLRALSARIRQQANNKSLKLGITEWNHTAGHWGPARSWLLTLYNALNAGRMLNMYQRLGDVVRIANRSNMTNSECSGILQTSADDIYFTPCYYVQRAYANLCGDRALQVDLGGEEILDVSATLRTGTGEAVLAVVNCTAQAEQRTIDLSDLGLTGQAVQVWTITGPAPDAVNSFEDKHCVAPVETVEQAQAGKLDHTFLPYSVTILRCG
jgi:alpha-N-arabinofuranosidase